MREGGLEVSSINTYIKAFNVFLAWLHENNHCVKLRLPKLKEVEKILFVPSDEQIATLIAYKPRNFGQERTRALIALTVDTGLRIHESLSLTRENLNLDQLMITIKGKGGKVRYVPMSQDLRKILFKFMRHEHDLIFPTRKGKKVTYFNAVRDLKVYLEYCKLPYFLWHSMRRYYATAYVKHGGNVFALRRVLGHSSVAVTQKYVNLVNQDLADLHVKLSPLSRVA